MSHVTLRHYYVTHHIASSCDDIHLHWSRKLCNCETFVCMKVEQYTRIWISVTADFILEVLENFTSYF